jgi:hypothetical protein
VLAQSLAAIAARIEVGMTEREGQSDGPGHAGGARPEARTASDHCPLRANNAMDFLDPSGTDSVLGADEARQ